MLQIKNISKQYKTGDLIQNALNDVSLNFRDNEFVSILGPSGSGKTTLLNIIGGLDRYDSGDLIINNVSTKNYKDRDWDSYRNHTIGFVFQSYNLIPHQTVLANVELALTISGISKKERKKRALDALEQVGLKEQAHKKPTQMSGGQMQRVAIARALVNNPDILLADEPTGALDTETSIQVMNLLKEVAHDRLVIMVTHNPELAEEYSTRIVRLKDGKIIDDSDPYIVADLETEKPKHKNLGKASMSLPTAFSLSFNNLLTKKARTILTAFAGSIGIIGIALILALSTGFQNYIDKIQEDTLISYPLTITSETTDITSMLLSMVSESQNIAEGEAVKEQKYISSMFANVGKNDLKAFKAYLDEHEKEVDDMTSLVKYSYSVTPLIYTIDCNDEVTQLNPNQMLTSLGMSSTMASMSPVASMTTSIFSELLDDQETLESQYDVLAGRLPENYDEMILILPEPNAVSDMMLYCLGLRDMDEMKDMMVDLMAGEEVEATEGSMEFTYEELMDLEFKLVNASDTYKYNSEYNLYESMTDDEAYMKDVYDNSTQLKIVGIMCAKEGSSSTGMTSGVGYTKALVEHVIAQAETSEIVQKQLANEELNVFSGKNFDDESEESGLNFSDMISVDTDMLSSAFGVNISEDDIAQMTKGYMTEISSSITADTSEAETRFNSILVTLAANLMNDYIEENGKEISMSQVQESVGGILDQETEDVLPEEFEGATLPEGFMESVTAWLKETFGEYAEENQETSVMVAEIKMSQVDGLVNKVMQEKETKEMIAALEKDYLMPADVYSSMYSELLKGMLQAYISMATLDAEAEDVTGILTTEMVEPYISMFMSQDAISSMSRGIATTMTETVMQKEILSSVGELTGELMGSIATAFNVDQNAIAAAFKFELDESELSRLMEAMTTSETENNAKSNLLTLGYQDIEDPTSIAFYFEDFDSKELFVDFIAEYNEKAAAEDEEKEINYTDLTGILMSSVKTIVDSVSYVLIAFVSISLVVSSIMIGIVTYISVQERTKEIGVLRAIGASKKNISSIFNAETFIVGFLAGLLGIGVTESLVPLINHIIHSLTGNYDINAVLAFKPAAVLVTLSVILTLIGGLIPSKQAARKDPVLALRSE